MTTNTLDIPLTGKPPVRIVKDDWPVIASASDSDNREHDFQANRHWKLKVRQHADGRAIVYGSYDSVWQNERDVSAGELLQPGEDIPAAIARVADAIGEPALAQECIEDLPPMTL